MVHPPTQESITRARFQSDRAVLELITSMAALARTQQSAPSILRYMLAAHNYKITHVVLGAYPYSDNMVPRYGSAYAQCLATPDSPTIDIIRRHFYQDTDDSSTVVDCFRNSWRTLLCGYLWMNVMCSRPSESINDVSRLLEIERMQEFMCTLLLRQRDHLGTNSVTILALGREAQYVAYNMSRRLKSQNISCSITNCAQPALLSRVTYNRNVVGVDPNYRCFTPGAIKFITQAASLYKSVQGTPESQILCTMPSAIDSLIGSGIQTLGAQALSLSRRAEQINCSVDIPRDASMEMKQLAKDHRALLDIVREQTVLTQQLIEIISTNAFVSATIQDRLIGSAAASAASQPVGAVTTGVDTIPRMQLPQTVTHPKTSVDDQSSVTESILDALSPIRVSYTPRANASTRSMTSTPSAVREPVKFSAALNNPSDRVVTEKEEMLSAFNRMMSFKADI